jgi:hypothetical protein
MGDRETHTRFLSVNLKGRDHLEDVSINGKIALKGILNK